MKHTNRMLLIPEDVYQKLTGGSGTSHQSCIKKKPRHKLPSKGRAPRLARPGKQQLSRLFQQPSGAPEDPLIQQSLQALAGSRRDTSDGGDDYARNVHYQQEFRRQKKLTEDRDERPVRVTFTADDRWGKSPPVVSSSAKKRAKKRKGAAAGNTDASATPVAESSSYTSATAAEHTEDDYGGEEAQPTIDQIMAHIVQHAAAVHVTPDGEMVVNPTTGEPVRTSSVREIVEFALQRRAAGRPPMTPPNLRREQLPTGYARFLQNIQGDRFLRAALGSYTATTTAPRRGDHRTRHGQYGQGGTPLTASFKRSGSSSKSGYMHQLLSITSFKPQLW